MRKVYFDNAATTPVHPEVVLAMAPYHNEIFGNPGSIHGFGRKAREAVEEARHEVHILLNSRKSEEIIFTSGGTEADNLAIIGCALANKGKGRHIITSQIEHHAVLHPCEYLEKEFGFEVTYLSVDKEGRVSPFEFAKAIRKDTILASIMMANNEIGTIQPIKELAKIAHDHSIVFHTDAVQAVGNIPVDVQDLGVDMLSLSAHKFNGPKGVGALYVKKGTKIHSYLHGGAQERKLRAGTHNTAGLVGLGKASNLARIYMQDKVTHLINLRELLISGIESSIGDSFLNGSKVDRLPGNINFCFPYIEGESILLHLDIKGIAASSGSACTSDSLEPSHVLLAIGLSPEVAHGSLRLSLGAENTEDDVKYLLEVLPGIIRILREMSPLYKAMN